MTGSSYNNGVSESRSYGSDNTLSSISYSGASIGNLSYSWDDNKNKTAETITGTMSNYGFSIPTSGYDSEDRLVTFNRTSGLNQSWSLSTVGDWNSQTTNGTSQARTHGPTHELTAVAGNAVSTDIKGNMSLIPSAARNGGSSLALAWDMDNRLKSADVGGNGIDVTYQFDALGRRVARTASGTTTVYVQSGQQTIADYTAGANSSSPLYRYVYAIDNGGPVLRHQRPGGIDVYYHSNERYSVFALTNSSAAILERYAYTAYGVPTITNASGTVLNSSAYNNRYTYSGREWENILGLMQYGLRMYAPSMGRFNSRDSSQVYLRTSRISEYSYSIPLHPDVVPCRLGLEAVAAGWRLRGFTCGAARLEQFLGGASNPPCPASCLNALQTSGGLPSGTCMQGHMSGSSQCGRSGSNFISISGSHNFGRSGTLINELVNGESGWGNSGGDLHFAFGQTSWTADGYCKFGCDQRNCIGCCKCNHSCNLRVKISDEYDFCSSLPNGGRDLSRYNPLRCACYLENLFDLDYPQECTYFTEKSGKHLSCPGAQRAPDCDTTSHDGFPPLLENPSYLD